MSNVYLRIVSFKFQNNLLNPAGGARSLNFGRKASLSNESWTELITLTNDNQTTGELQNAYIKTAEALMSPSGYKVHAMIKRAPIIPIHSVSTGSSGIERAFTITHEIASTPSK